MKQNELSKHLKCSVCGNHVAHSGLPIFWRVKVERFGIDTTAVKRQLGLSTFLGSYELASVMGPDEDMTIDLMAPKTMTLCEKCALGVPVAIALETGEENV